jgi:CBS domain-containing protein
MITEFRSLHPNDLIAVGVGHVVRGFQQDFPVVDEGGAVVGILTRTDLIAALAKDGPTTPVRDVMRRDFVTAHPRDMLPTALARLEEDASRTLPVVENGRLLGLVTADNLAEVLMIRQSLGERSKKA